MLCKKLSSKCGIIKSVSDVLSNWTKPSTEISKVDRTTVQSWMISDLWLSMFVYLFFLYALDETKFVSWQIVSSIAQILFPFLSAKSGLMH